MWLLATGLDTAELDARVSGSSKSYTDSNELIGLSP